LMGMVGLLTARRFGFARGNHVERRLVAKVDL